MATEYVSDNSASLQYMLPQAPTSTFKQLSNDIREGLLAFADDVNNYGTLYLINGDGFAQIPKAMSCSPDILFDGNVTTTGACTLAGSIDKYNYIVVCGQFNDGVNREQAVSLFIPKNMYYVATTSASAWNHLLNATISGYTRRLVFGFTSPTTLTLVVAENMSLLKVLGY